MKQKDKKKFKGSLVDVKLSEIPQGYHIDTIIIMPVNVDTSFIYWEITDGLLNGKLRELNISSANLMIKIFGTDRQKEIHSFNVKDKIGKRYINYLTSFKPLTAKIGLLNDGEFIGLLKSKTVSTPSFEIRETEDEIWMKKTEDMSEIVSVARSETRISEEIEFLKYYEESASSHEIPLSSGVLLTLPSSGA